MKIRSSPAWRRVLPAAGLIALAAYLAVAVPLGLAAAWTRIHLARTDARDDAWAALARTRGRAYAEAIERIREVLPENERYLLVHGGRGATFVRFDLAPRQAVWGGELGKIASSVTPATLATLPRWTVISGPTGPRLVETRVLAEKGGLP